MFPHVQLLTVIHGSTSLAVTNVAFLLNPTYPQHVIHNEMCEMSRCHTVCPMY